MKPPITGPLMSVAEAARRHPDALEPPKQRHPVTKGEWLQFAIGLAIGCWVYAAGDTHNPRDALGALLVGWFGMWLLIKLYVRIRFGRRAAKSMTLG